MKRLEKSNITLVIIGIVIMLGILVPAVLNSIDNHNSTRKLQEQIREARSISAALRDCNQRLIVSVNVRGQYANLLREVDRERQGILLEVATEPDIKKRQALFFSRNKAVDEKEQAVIRDRDKFPLPKLDDCKKH